MKQNGHRCYLRVVNWDKFQHYKDRNPPWIKFYAELLEDPGVAALPDASKGHLFGIWLLASRLENKIPWDAAFIGHRINATTKIDLKGLITLAFLEPAEECLQHASNMLATCATPLDGLYTETETETEQRQIAPPPATRIEATLVPALSWSNEAASDWIERHGGKPPGAMFKALGGLTKAVPWSRVRPVLRHYLATREFDFLSWPKFASGFGTLESEALNGSPARASPKAQAKLEGMKRAISGGLLDERSLGQGDGVVADGRLEGPGEDAGRDGTPVEHVSQATRPPERR